MTKPLKPTNQEPVKKTLQDSIPGYPYIGEPDITLQNALQDAKRVQLPTEQAAGWNYLDELLPPKDTLHTDLDKALDELAAAAKRREAALKSLDNLALQDAKRDVAKYYAKEDAQAMVDDGGIKWTATQKPQPTSNVAPRRPMDGDPITAEYWNNQFLNEPLTLDSLHTSPAVDLHLPTDRAILDKLTQLEKKLSGLDESLNVLSQNKAVKQDAKASPPVRDVFVASDLLELERILDELERGKAIYPPPSMQPTKVDIDNFIKTLEDMGAKVTPVNYSPVATPNDLHTYLEREAMAKSKNGWVTEPDGTSKHYVNGVLHMDGNNPAEVRPNGTQLFYKHGSLHRDGNLPAMVGARGTAKFAVDGRYHRLGGLPAVTWSKGPYRSEFWVNGEIQHAIKKDGTEEWYAPGCDDRDEAVLHRVDGPAVIHPNKREEFWINGNQFNTREQWISALSRLHDMREEALDQELIDEDPVDAIADEDEPATITKASKGKKEKKMTKPSFTESLKANAVSAGYRVAGTQLTATIKGAILTVMRDKGADGGAIQAFSAFLDTEFGAAMISFMIGSGLPYVPHFGDDPRVQRLATELQVGGMATAGNAIIGEAMQHVLPAITQILQSLPAADGETTSNVRVIESKESKLAETLLEEEEDAETDATETSSKTMKA